MWTPGQAQWRQRNRSKDWSPRNWGLDQEIRAERQMDGIKKAKERGVHFGQRKTLNPEQTSELQEERAQGTLIRTLMKDYNLSKSSVYRYLDNRTPISATS